MTTSNSNLIIAARMPVLDGFRAFAVLLVFTAHPADRSFWDRFNGPSGVTLFFVLSGFLITTLLLNEERRNVVSLKSFYVKRFFRIYPMYFLILFLYIILIFVFGLIPERRDLFLSELPYYFSPIPEHAYFSHQTGLAVPSNGLWSIGIEEKFYIFWPMIAFGAVGLFKKKRMTILLIFLLICIYANFHEGVWRYVVPYLPIILGCIGALIWSNQRMRLHLGRLNSLKTRYSILLFTALIQFSSERILMGHPMYPIMSFLFILTILAFVGAREDPILGSKLLRYVAELSYCLYLTHNFFLNFVEALFAPFEGQFLTIFTTLLGLTLAFVFSHILNRFFERPLRNLGRKIALKYE